MINDFLQLGLLLVPFVVAAVVIHLLEFFIQFRLSRRFGWNSILITGWLGTPIHEFSHAIMCYTFRHEIKDMALFKPDRESGRLGYVQYSYRKGSIVQELGNFFIGVAPLVGGTLMLALLLFVFYPQLGMQLLRGDSANGENIADLDWWNQILVVCHSTFNFFFSLERIASIRFWIFLYLSLCVASHMAPSRSDYAGSSKAAAWIAMTLVISMALIASVGLAEPVVQWATFLTRPVLALLTLAVMLSLLCAVFVGLITGVWDLFRK